MGTDADTAITELSKLYDEFTTFLTSQEKYADQLKSIDISRQQLLNGVAAPGSLDKHDGAGI